MVKKVDPVFVAKLAVYSRKEGYMKDMPAVLAAYLSTVDAGLLRKIFAQVVDNGKMLRNFFQAIKSGKFGRTSFGRAPSSLIQGWFDSHDEDYIFRNSIGNDPSFSDIIHNIHIKPKNKAREALYGYIMGKKVVTNAKDMVKSKSGKFVTVQEKTLPGIVREYEAFKRFKLDGKKCVGLPDVPFQMLDSLNLSSEDWKEVAKNAPWHMCRMNLNTFMRHGVFADSEMVTLIADKLKNEYAIKKSKVFPYQLFSAFTYADAAMPHAIREALQDALDVSLYNVPEMAGNIVVCPDVSGSMKSPITQARGVASKIRCVDVAGLVASAILRKNKSARVIPFENDVVNIPLNSRDSVMTNAAKLAAVGGGGTCCAAPLVKLIKEDAKVDLIVYVSDNESWINPARHTGYGWGRTSTSGTAVMDLFQKLKHKNPNLKMVCIDLTPNTTLQAPDRKDILNIGGFSDTVFELMDLFHQGLLDAKHWVDVVKKVQL
ncbi:MAG: RNA-binding protein [Candidatus Pacearchaeota archaeon]